MLRNILAALSGISSLVWWFSKESIKHGFFEKVVHTARPWEANVIEYGIPAAFAVLCLWLLWEKPPRAAPQKSTAPTKPQSPFTITGDQNVVSQNQSGGVTTHTYVNQADPPRRLTAEQFARIKSAVQGSCKVIGHISITAALSNNEAQVYGMDFVNAFRAAGCNSDLQLPIPGLTPDVTAIHIGVRDAQNIPPEAQKLHDVLRSVGIEFFTTPIKPDFFPENKFVLVIGAKP